MYLLYAQVASIRGECNVDVTLTERKKKGMVNQMEEGMQGTQQGMKQRMRQVKQQRMKQKIQMIQHRMTLQKTVVPLALPKMVTQGPYLLV